MHKTCSIFSCPGGFRPGSKGVELEALYALLVSHKIAPLGRLINRYGAYLNHLTTLTEDLTVKASDKQRLKGYILKWCDSKMLIGCGLFHDLLKPSTILCKILQDEEIFVVSAIDKFKRVIARTQHMD